MPDYRCRPYVPPPGSEQARWDAAIAGLVEIMSEYAPSHERLKPTYTITQGKCWQIRLPDGRTGWAPSPMLDSSRPTYYLPVDVARECALRQAIQFGYGITWARQQEGRDFGTMYNLMRDAILNATLERLNRHESELIKCRNSR